MAWHVICVSISLSHFQSQYLISSHMLSHWVRNQSFSLPAFLPIYLYCSPLLFILALLYRLPTLSEGTNEHVSSPTVITPGLCPWSPSFFPIVGDKITPLCHHQTGCTSVWFNTALHQFADAFYFRGMHQDYKSSAFQRLFNINTDPTPEKIDGRVWSCRLSLWNHFSVFSFLHSSSPPCITAACSPLTSSKEQAAFFVLILLGALCCSAVPAYCCPRRPAPFWKAAALFCNS